MIYKSTAFLNHSDDHKIMGKTEIFYSGKNISLFPSKRISMW